MFLKIRLDNSKIFSLMQKKRVKEWISKLRGALLCQSFLIKTEATKVETKMVVATEMEVATETEVATEAVEVVNKMVEEEAVVDLEEPVAVDKEEIHLALSSVET